MSTLSVSIKKIHSDLRFGNYSMSIYIRFLTFPVAFKTLLVAGGISFQQFSLIKCFLPEFLKISIIMLLNFAKTFNKHSYKYHMN